MPEFRDCGGNLVSWEEPPRRIVSLVPSQTELLFDLGLGDRVVGVTRFCVHPAEAKRDKTVIGGTKDFRAERIAELEPDLVIGNKEENTREGIAELAERWPVWISDVADLEGALGMIREVGALTDASTAADRMAEQIRSRFEVLRAKAVVGESGAESRVAYLIWRDPYMVAGGGTFIDSMLRCAGWLNAFGDLERYPEVTMEQLIDGGVDRVLLSSEPYPFKERHVLELRDALPDCTDVRLVDGEIFSWYGSRLLDAPTYLRSLR